MWRIFFLLTAVSAWSQAPGYVGDFYRTSNPAILLPDSQRKVWTVTDRQFGAVHNGVPGANYSVTGTDDTAAIQKCIDACATNGGGTVFFPAGIYVLSSPARDPAGVANCQLLISRTLEIPVTVRLVGDYPPSHRYTQTATTNGTILWSTATSGSVITAVSTNGTPGAGGGNVRSSVNVELENLTVRVPPGSGMSGINLSNAFSASVESVTVDHGWSMYGDTTRPIPNTSGLIMPTIDNGGFGGINLSHAFVGGFDYGIALSSHTFARNCTVFNCWNGYQLLGPGGTVYASTMIKCEAYGCKVQIISQMNYYLLTCLGFVVQNSTVGWWSGPWLMDEQGGNCSGRLEYSWADSSSALPLTNSINSTTPGYRLDIVQTRWGGQMPTARYAQVSTYVDQIWAPGSSFNIDYNLGNYLHLASASAITVNGFVNIMPIYANGSGPVNWQVVTVSNSSASAWNFAWPLGAKIYATNGVTTTATNRFVSVPGSAVVKASFSNDPNVTNACVLVSY